MMMILRKKPHLESLFRIGMIKRGIIALALMLFILLLEFIPYFERIVENNIFLTVMGKIIVVLFVVAFLMYALVMYQINNKNKNMIKVKLSIRSMGESRYDLITTNDIVIEAVQSEYEKYIMKDSNVSDSDSDYLFFEKPGKHLVTVYEELTPKKIDFWKCSLYIYITY